MTGVLAVEASPADILREVAHLTAEEVGAMMLLVLHLAAGGAMPADDAGRSQVSRLGAAWFRPAAGALATRGDRIMEAILKLRVATAAAIAPPAGQQRAPSPAPDLSQAQRAQRKVAARARWDVRRGSGQMPLPFDPAPPGPQAVPPAAAARASTPPPPPPLRPDADEISEEKAVDFIRGWLWQYKSECRGAMPDAATCRNVLRAAPGRSLMEIYSALNSAARRRARPGDTWGWFVAVVRNHFAAVNGHAATA